MKTTARDTAVAVSGTQRVSTRRATSLVLGLLAGLSASASAQQTETSDKSAEVSVGVASGVTSQDQLEQVNGIERRGNSVSQRLTKVLAEARRDRDILRANCVNRKLTEVNATVRNIESRTASFRSSLRLSDKSLSEHEYAVLSVLAQKLDVLEQEAAQCLGQAAYETGEALVVTTVAASTIAIDPSSVGTPDVSSPAVTVPPAFSVNN